ncbi:Caspase 6, apoptosis-related cysteine peptidase, like 2 [Oopsacas minuta]|uniref:Caspase 6, apoptosis-related cysteine peptidase, like 2 n=1 Tax=Oopsacas minuta TaxID=111878 RepID=A0AAV7KJY6_9METZ|nr:Caspase 6, apoptosis-related cysteine peptidase, like 2 [Oopsacas minuta]
MAVDTSEDTSKYTEVTKDLKGKTLQDGEVMYHIRPICRECEDELNYPFEKKGRGEGIIIVNKDFWIKVHDSKNKKDRFCKMVDKERKGADEDLKYLKGIYKCYGIDCQSYFNQLPVEEKTTEDAKVTEKGRKIVSKQETEELEDKNYEEINEIKVVEDKNYKEVERMEKIVQEFADNVKQNCPVVFVSIATHGGKQGKLQEAVINNQTTVQTLANILAQNHRLMGIPKVFIIQACRGKKREEAFSGVDDMQEEETIQFATKQSDFLMIYSTTEGYVSFRSEEQGSWLLEILYKCVTMQKYRNLHFVEVVTVCTFWVLNSHREISDDAKEDQEKGKEITEVRVTETPTYHSTLTKFLHIPVKEKNMKVSYLTVEEFVSVNASTILISDCYPPYTVKPLESGSLESGNL